MRILIYGAGVIGVRVFLMLKIAIASVGIMKAAFPPERFARDPEKADQEYKELQKYDRWMFFLATRSKSNDYRSVCIDRNAPACYNDNIVSIQSYQTSVDEAG